MRGDFLIKKSILLNLPAQNFSEQEYLTIKETLEKTGFKVFIASDANALCVGDNGMKVRPDVSFYNMNESNFGGIIFIGGKGLRNYWDNINLHQISKKFDTSKKPVGGICSAPVIFARAGLLNNDKATCYPDDRNELEREGVVYQDIPVFVSKNFITAQGPEAAFDFANAFIEQISKN
jgi:putative intracellular protease/amidase